MLAQALIKRLRDSQHPYAAFSRAHLDITDPIDVRKIPPQATVINCAGIVKDRIGVSQRRMLAVNAAGPHLLSMHAARVIQVSTDCVFDGRDGLYDESSEVCPVDLYGWSKACGELTREPHLTVRTSFIGFGRYGLLPWILGQQPSDIIEGYIDWWWNGLHVDVVAGYLIMLTEMEVTGLVHLVGPDVTKAELVKGLIDIVRPDLKMTLATPGKRDMRLRSAVTTITEPGKHTLDGMMEQVRADWEAWKKKMKL
jgi:dTDP-4-dehydrorhamnose reductase